MSERAFDSEAAAFAPSHAEGRQYLAEHEMEMLGFISSASNGTMLVQLGDTDAQRFAIYKPAQHERPLWDFPGDLYLREIAAYEVSQFLGWDVVPPTVDRDGPRGPRFPPTVRAARPGPALLRAGGGRRVVRAVGPHGDV